MSTHEQRWALHESPFRHYKHLKDDGKWSWQIGKQRIAGVTSVLDGGQDNLTQWSASQATTACTVAATRWLGAGPALAESLLSFAELAATTGLTPNQVRDSKARCGTAVHGYLAWRLCGGVPNAGTRANSAVPYGLCAAVDDFLRDYAVRPVQDALGPRVERAVGSVERAVGGTYDGQVSTWTLLNGDYATHRIDLKSSNTLQPKHWAQVAEYERCAVEGGESPSDYLTLVHIQPTGSYELFSIKTGSAEHELALAVFDAHLLNYRGLPTLGKLLKTTYKENEPV